MISAIVAQAKNRVIGSANDLPWYLPTDLKRFRRLTKGHSVIMGRKTYDSIISRLGHPLPERQNIVVTRDKNFNAPETIVVHSLKDALAAATSEEVFIIGGAQIYQQSLPLIDRIYMTEVDAEIDGDVYFPPLGNEWHETSREMHDKDEKNEYHYGFITLERAS